MLYNITASKGKDRMNQHLEIDEAFTENVYSFVGNVYPEKLATQKEQIQEGRSIVPSVLTSAPKMPVKTVRPLKTYVIELRG